MVNNCIIFVLADGHHNSLGLVRSLGRAGYHPIVYLIGSKDGLVKYSKYCKTLIFCDTVSDALDSIIDQYSGCIEYKFIVTGNDKFIAAVDGRYEELDGRFYTYNCGEAGKLTNLMSKVRQNELAQEAGLNVPPYAVVNVKDRTIPQIPFPVITKAMNSLGVHWKDIVYLCNTPEDLLEAYDKIECEQIMVQHYIPKKNETGFNGISINGGKEVYLPLQLTYKSTSETTFGNIIYLFKPTNTELVGKIKKLIESTGYSGSFSIDLLIGQDSKIYFLEINFRNSAWSFPYTCAGVNLPGLWVESTIKGSIDTSHIQISRLPYSSVDEITELYESSKKGLKNVLGTILSMFRSDSLILWNKKDLKPFLHCMKTVVKNRFRK